MRPAAKTAAKFAAIDAHDDTVEGFAIHPPTGRRKQATVEVTLFRHWQNKRRVLRFSKCANVALAMDTDVVANNWPINTHALAATADPAEITALMRRQKRLWHVRYDKSLDPLPAKLAASRQYVLFRVRLFGGLLEILAKSFFVKRMHQ